MKIFIFILSCVFTCSKGYTQTDTLIQKQKRGLLFLSKNNFQYDWKDGEKEMRSLGFHDFFFPCEEFDLKCLLDSNLEVLFKNGYRVDFIRDRRILKNKAKMFPCMDSSRCYLFDEFYILSATMTYRQYVDYEPFVCRRNYFELKVINGSKLRFEYQHQAIEPIVVR